MSVRVVKITEYTYNPLEASCLFVWGRAYVYNDRVL